MAKLETDILTVVNILPRPLEPGDITWDGKNIIRKTIKSGDSAQFTRSEALHIAKKIIDEKIIKTRGMKNLNNRLIREEMVKKILTETLDPEALAEEEVKEEPKKKEPKKEVKPEPKPTPKKVVSTSKKKK